MAPSFTLRKSSSPSRANLTLPLPSASSPLASPSSSVSSLGAHGGGGGGRSPTTPLRDASPGYFPPPNRPPPALVSREEAFKTVKAMEEVLDGWNEYRLAINNLGKAGRKLAGALKDLVGCMDKTNVSAQTMRPTSAMLDSISDLTLKLSRKIDREYDDANADASKYFTLLAKESRSHEAYLGAMGKKHDKAEKAYRKAAKGLAETATAHAGLVQLKDTLSTDITRANHDHMSLLGSKQSTLLLRLASSSGALAGNLLSFFSDGLRKSGTAYRDVEYFRALADIQWQSALPDPLDDATEEKRRDELRLLKARVALGELDLVGDKVWAGLAPTTRSLGQSPVEGTAEKGKISPPQIGAAVRPAISPTKTSDTPQEQTTPANEKAQVEEPTHAPPRSDEKVPPKASPPTTTALPASDTLGSTPPADPPAAALPTQPAQGAPRPPLTTQSQSQARNGHLPPGAAQPPREAPRETGYHAHPTSTSDPGSHTSPTWLSSSSRTVTSSTGVSSLTSASSPLEHYEVLRPWGDAPPKPAHAVYGPPSGHARAREDEWEVPAPGGYPTRSNQMNQMYEDPRASVGHGMNGSRPSHTARASSMAAGVPVPGVKRSVSQIAADMEARDAEARESEWAAHALHSSDGRFVRDCGICRAEYERMTRPVREDARAQDDSQAQAQIQAQAQYRIRNEERGSRRVTMPPSYASAGNLVSVGQHGMETGARGYAPPQRETPRETRAWQHTPLPPMPMLQSSGRRASYHPGVELVAPRPTRAVGMSPELEDYGR